MKEGESILCHCFQLVFYKRFVSAVNFVLVTVLIIAKYRTSFHKVTVEVHYL